MIYRSVGNLKHMGKTSSIYTVLETLFSLFGVCSLSLIYIYMYIYIIVYEYGMCTMTIYADILSKIHEIRVLNLTPQLLW